MFTSAFFAMLTADGKIEIIPIEKETIGTITINGVDYATIPVSQKIEENWGNSEDTLTIKKVICADCGEEFTEDTVKNHKCNPTISKNSIKAVIEPKIFVKDVKITSANKNNRKRHNKGYSDRVIALLETGPRTHEEISTALKFDKKQTAQIIGSMARYKKIIKVENNRWGLA